MHPRAEKSIPVSRSADIPRPPPVDVVLKSSYSKPQYVVVTQPPRVSPTTPQIVYIRETPYTKAPLHQYKQGSFKPFRPQPQYQPQPHPHPHPHLQPNPNPHPPPQPVYHPIPHPPVHTPSPAPPVINHQHHHVHQYKPTTTTTTTRKPKGSRYYFPAPNIAGVLQDEDASTLIDLLEQADLVDALSEEGPFTVFAPTNEAFEKLDPNLVNALLADDDLLKSVLLYHVLPSEVNSDLFHVYDTLDTLLQDEKENVTRKLRLTKNKEHGIISVNGAEIIHSLVDQTAKNGIVHFIDEVIYPIPTGTIYDYIKEDDRFRTLFQAIENSEKVTQLLNSTGSFTIFAPTDDAFDQLPRQAVNELIDDTKALENILTKHVVTRSLLSPSLTFVDLVTAGKAKIKVKVRRGQVYVEEAKIIDGDIMATNGVIQVIDKVLL